MTEGFDMSSGDCVATGRPSEDGKAFEVRFYNRPGHGREQGEVCELTDEELGEPAVFIRVHDARACEGVLQAFWLAKGFFKEGADG